MLARAVVALLLAALALPSADAQADAAEVRAEVTLPTAFAERLDVVLRADGPTWTQLPDGTIVELDAARPHAYSMPIARPALGFALIRAPEVVPLNVASIALRAPEGWTTVHSSSVLAFGQGLVVDARAAGQARVRIASVGEPAPADVALATKGLAYLAAQHERAPDDFLLLRAPNNALAESITASDTIVVPQDAPIDEVARLLARAHQRYRVVEVAPASAAWFREGEERLQSETALLAAGLRTSAQLDETFTRARAVAEPEARLPQAPAGSTLARNKGLVVVRALDVELRNASGGREGLADLLDALDSTTNRLDSAAIESAAVALAGPRLADFFARYVYGSAWPATPGARDAADVVVRELALAPQPADIGEQIVVSYAVVNRGTQASELDLVLRVDGAAARTLAIRLPVGVRESSTTTITSGAAGEHVVALGGLNASLHVRGPASLRLLRAASVPDEPAEAEAFTLLVYVENAGETTGRARVEVYEEGELVQRTTDAFVDGETTAAVTLPVRFDEPGLHALEVRLVGDGVEQSISHLVSVRVARGEDVPAPGILLTIVSTLLAMIGSARRRG